jgi:hypothetical protein
MGGIAEAKTNTTKKLTLNPKGNCLRVNARCE